MSQNQTEPVHTEVEADAYRVQVSLDGIFWFIEVPEIDGATQARFLGEVETMASDYIELKTGDKNPKLDVHFILPDDVSSHLNESMKLRRESEALKTASAIQYSYAAKALKDRGMTVREIGKLLGISHQRAQQLTSSQLGKANS